jgi:multiple sugar transport system permease protein
MRKRVIGEAGWSHSAIAGAVGFIYFFPVLFIILTAFRNRMDTLATPPKWFFSPTFENFYHIFYRSSSTTSEYISTGFHMYFFNSIYISGMSVILALIIGTLAAYGFSRHPLKGNETYLFIILTTRMLPPIIVIIPIFLIFRLTGLAGSYTGIIMMYTCFNLPFSIWMMKSFFDELNTEIEDAARMDGASERSVFFGICIPQVKAGLAATSVFALILTWNEFLFALLLTNKTTRTMPNAMARTIGGEINVDYGLLAAMICLFLIPIFFVTYALQNQLLRGVTFGTIKK